MKRIASAVRYTALMLLCLLAIAPPAVQAQTFPQPNPNFVSPSLFPGFEPIEPDQNGISPSFQYLVLNDGDQVQVIRLFDEIEVFRADVRGDVEVGFDPSDRRLFLTETVNDATRFRFVDLTRGGVLLDLRLRSRPEIRTNVGASGNLLIVREALQTQVLVFNEQGNVTFRLTNGNTLRFALNVFVPVAAFVEPLNNGTVRVQVINTVSGRLIFRTTVPTLSVIGFSPEGAAFVIARPTSSSSFRVQLVDTFLGRTLVNRNFSGPVNAGFTPDGSLLGIRELKSRNEKVFLFSTITGRQVSFR